MTSREFLQKYREEMRGKPVDVALEQAFWLIGWLRLEELEAVATQLLAEGYDTPSLVEIAAGLADSYNIDMLAEKTFGEIGQKAISKDTAGLYVARQIAGRILDGSLSADDGASLLARMYSPLGFPSYLTGFSVLEDYLEEGNLDPEECRREIIVQAEKLLEDGWNPDDVRGVSGAKDREQRAESPEATAMDGEEPKSGCLFRSVRVVTTFAIAAVLSWLVVVRWLGYSETIGGLAFYVLWATFGALWYGLRREIGAAAMGVPMGGGAVYALLDQVSLLGKLAWAGVVIIIPLAVFYTARALRRCIQRTASRHL